MNNTVVVPASVFAADGIVALTNEEIEERKRKEAQKEPVYIDQLIDDAIAEDDPNLLDEEAETSEEESQANFHAFDISSGFRHSRSEDGRSDNSASLSLDAYYQTFDYGDLSASVVAEREEFDHRQGESEQGGYITLRQSDFVLNENWTMDNTLGVVQSTLNPVFSRSGRVLSNQVTQGVRLRAYNKKTEWRFHAGEQGSIEADANFQGNDNSLVGLGFARHLNKQWTVATQLWHNRDLEDESSTELALSAQFNGKENTSANLQVLGNGEARGLWFTGEFTHGRFTHETGLSYVQEGLSWMGSDFAEQGKGGYWRTSYTHPKYSFNTFLDWDDNNQTQSYQISQGGHYRLNKNTQFASSVSYRETESDVRNSTSLQLSSSINYRFSNGQQGNLRLTAGRQESDSALNDRSRSFGINYSQQVFSSDIQQLGLQLALNRQLPNDDETIDNVQMGLSWQKELGNGASLQSNVSANRSYEADHIKTDVSLQLKGRYELDEHWVFEASVDQSRNTENDDRQLGVYFSINYAYSNGKAVNKAARRSGHVKGVVFLDENNDGIKQPLEKSAAGVIINLNKGSSVKSNKDGEFEFGRVREGRYSLSVDESSIPLPWEFAEKPGNFQVKLRQTKIINIPLVKLDGE